MKTLFILAVSMMSATAFAAPTEFLCGGSSPHWSISVGPQAISVMKAGDLSAYRPVAARAAANSTLDYVQVYQTSVKNAEAWTPVSIVIRVGDCNDGVSDEIRSHSVVVIEGAAGTSTILEGCCNVVK